METALLKEVVQSLPKTFVAELLRGIEWAYEEAYNSAQNDPLLDRPEREYLYPHYRRVIIEKRIRDVSRDLNLKTAVAQNEAGNHEFTEITAGRLLLTCSHKNGEDWRMLRSSQFRCQNATLNSLLCQMEFKGAGFEAFQVEDDGGLLNGVIFHGTDRAEKNKVGYLRLGFPATDNRKWAAHFDFHEILGAYQPEAPSADDDALIVKWKKKVTELPLEGTSNG
jgi:hypothetical protein